MSKWFLKTKKADFKNIANNYNIDQVTARIMVNRDIKDFKKYIYGDLNDLYNPHKLKDIDKAAEIIKNFIENKRKIIISTDFDVDGIMSGYILYSAINRLGGVVNITAPSRQEGYGINEDIVKRAYEDGYKLIITTDNGISAIEPIKYAKQLGITVVVTDHHEVSFVESKDGERHFILPDADAIVNHKRSDCTYPFKGLCGAGIAFKLVSVLYELYNLPNNEYYEFLEFAAIATVADVMELTDENRIIVKKGLEKIQNTKNLGLKALIYVNGLSEKKMTAYSIGFIIGPCFNAAGRLETIDIAIKLLQCNNEEDAMLLANSLKELNDERRDMTINGLKQAVEIIERDKLYENKIILVILDGIKESVVGIVAGRIKEKYNHPIYVFANLQGDLLKGSGRSIEEYNMFEGLIKCKHLIEKFGGHKMAAGLTIKKENFLELRKCLNEDANLTKEDFEKKIYIDVNMPIDYITKELIQEFEILEPFGNKNPRPIFAEQHFYIMSARLVGRNQNVIQMILKNQNGYQIRAVYFKDIERFNDFIVDNYGEEKFNILYSGNNTGIDIGFIYYPSINEYNGRESLQIVIEDFSKIQN